MLIRSAALFSLFVVLPVLAADNAAPPKKDAPPPNKKETPSDKKLQPVGTIAGKLTRANTDEHTIQIETRVPGGRYGRNDKQDYSLIDDVKIRVLKLPDRLDEKDKPIPYTAAEKAKLKGDNPKLPGYSAELSALSNGQIVELHLATTKPAPGTKKKDANAEPEKPVVTMIVIAADAPKMPEKDKERKKKE